MTQRALATLESIAMQTGKTQDLIDFVETVKTAIGSFHMHSATGLVGTLGTTNVARFIGGAVTTVGAVLKQFTNTSLKADGTNGNARYNYLRYTGSLTQKFTAHVNARLKMSTGSAQNVLLLLGKNSLHTRTHAAATANSFVDTLYRASVDAPTSLRKFNAGFTHGALSLATNDFIEVFAMNKTGTQLISVHDLQLTVQNMILAA